jgi:hypothetical protein
MCAVRLCTDEAIAYVTGDDNVIAPLCADCAYETITDSERFVIHEMPKATR